jgi:hypothetical protein
MSEKLSCQCFVVYLQLVVLCSAFRVPRYGLMNMYGFIDRDVLRIPCFGLMNMNYLIE